MFTLQPTLFHAILDERRRDIEIRAHRASALRNGRRRPRRTERHPLPRRAA